MRLQKGYRKVSETPKIERQIQEQERVHAKQSMGFRRKFSSVLVQGKFDPNGIQFTHTTIKEMESFEKQNCFYYSGGQTFGKSRG